ncbi:ferric-dicitrate binding protein FerR (iron transport regulator) [Chryseobacterium rhizosphaerae]|uniref:FecR family protein n=1 Tax=Chryseobacterium rhizosphaerae TaxID=395937 RepID=UPI00286163FC|nr:FecR domain-containing protein [Chryseobacterium rhizosphaerae]MDR6546487.1 ferric-dicitrate binding protein FerR (iron transport regulator) [Chryseobacterium rhizosphaerae]
MKEEQLFDGFEITELLHKYITGQKLPSWDREFLEDWIEESESNRAIFQQLLDQHRLASDLVELKKSGATTEAELAKFNKILDKPGSMGIWLKLMSAAAILFTISISLWLYKHYQSDKILPTEVATATLSGDVLPGTDKATLTFEDGQVINLSGNKKAIKIDEQGTTYLDGTAISPIRLQFATLTTPRKGQYKVTLSDGTKVWLNAESSLKYPTTFTGKDRYVELQGEGYFEVAHDKAKPFIVASNGQQVKVLGTRFNINSYPNEPTVRTTLISGRVELMSSRDKSTVILDPGQQAKLVNAGFAVNPVDTEPYTAWTANEFQFKGTTLQEVLRQVERWYDVEVDYSNIPIVKVNGTISREKKLSSVLYALEKITDLQITLSKGRRIEIKR